MENNISRNTKVGIFIFIGTILIITALYYIGSKQNLFGSSFRVSANFNNVNGLQAGNNVRFGGINIGTVEKVNITSDSTINVIMLLDEETKQYIKKNAVVSIGTDGLMGNKLININSVNITSSNVNDGDVLQSLKPIATDEMLRTLNRTNEDVAIIAQNLKNFTTQINNSKGLLQILRDSVIAQDVKIAIRNLKTTTQKTTVIANDLNQIVNHVKAGKGTVGKLIYDDAFVIKLNQTMTNVKSVSDTLTLIFSDLKFISHKIKKGDGAVGSILYDTVFVNNLNKSIKNIESGTRGFDQVMEAARHNFLFRGYFKKQEKEKEKEKEKLKKTKE
jgi:phospholipid/cholesterol/gamma-HCH transport system substrate-binding protein